MIPLASGAEAWSQTLAMVLALAFAIGIAFIILFNKWNRPDLDTDHAAHILSQLNGFGGTGGGAVVVRSPDALDDVETLRDIRGLFHGEQSGEVRVRSATWHIAHEVRSELRSRTPDASKVPARAAQEALLTAIFGALAILPVATWREMTQSGGAAFPGPADILAAVGSILTGMIGWLTAFPLSDVLFAFGLTFGILGMETVWTLWWGPPILLTVLAGAYWILERRVETERELTGPPVRTWAVRFVTLAVITWFVGTSLAVIGGVFPGLIRIPLGLALAVAFMALYVRSTTRPERLTVTDGGEPREDGGEDDENRFFTPEISPAGSEDADDPEDGAGSEDAGHGTFAYDPGHVPDDSDDVPEDGDEPEDAGPGTVSRVIGRVRRANWKHTAVLGALGFGFAHELAAFLAAFAVMGAVSSMWVRRTLYRWSRSAERDGRDAFALDVVHSVTVTAAALTLPLMIGYATLAIGTGKVIRVAGAVAESAAGGTILALGILGVMIVLTAAVMFLDRFAELRMGLRRALSVQSVRLALFGKALPFALMTVTAIIALAALRKNIVMVVAVTFAVGLIARFAFQVYHYANYRYQSYEGRDKSAGRVVVNGRQVTDADGEPVFVADVNGHRTAHRRVDPLLTQIRADARSLFRDGTPETGSFPRYYYKHGVSRGKVDMESVADELLGDVRTRFEANVKKTDADAPTIMEKLRSEYPSHVVEQVVEHLQEKSMVTRREDTFVWLGR